MSHATNEAGGRGNGNGAKTGECRILRLDEIHGETAAWVWPGRFHCGQVTVVAGEAGSGKSALAADIAARVSNGEPWPDASTAGKNSPAAVVIAQADKHTNHVVKRRLLAADGDAQKLAIVNRPEASDASPAAALGIALEAALAEVGDCSLVIIDDLAGWLKHAAPRPHEWASMFDELAEWAARHQVALVVVWRLEKASRAVARRTLDMLTGLAPVVWLLCRDSYNPGGRIMVCAQNHLGRPSDNLAFDIDGDRLVWRRPTRELADDDALAPCGVDRHERKQAGAWLLKLLEDGPIEAKRLWEEAKSCHLAERTVRRAAAELGLHPMKDGQDGPWRWGWDSPDDRSRPDRKGAPAPNVAAFQTVGSLPTSPAASAAQSVAAFEAVGSLPNSPAEGPQRQSPTSKTVAALESVGSLPQGARQKATAHARRRPPNTRQLDAAIQDRLGHSPLGPAGVEYGNTNHIQIAPKPKPK